MNIYFSMVLIVKRTRNKMRRKTIIERQNVYNTDMNRNLIQMVRFIEQEGKEKVDELESITEEECMILKHKIMKAEIEKINNTYEAKEFRAKQLDQINSGKLMQKAGMVQMDAKIEIFEEIESEVRENIIKDMACSKRRWNIMQRLIMESLFKLLEKEIIIKCRQVDANLLTKILPDIETIYEKLTQKKTHLQLDDVYLPDDSLPGVYMRTPNNKISIVNTLDDRLKQVMKSSLPVMNQIFFGTSKMRK